MFPVKKPRVDFLVGCWHVKTEAWGWMAGPQCTLDCIAGYVMFVPGPFAQHTTDHGGVGCWQYAAMTLVSVFVIL